MSYYYIRVVKEACREKKAAIWEAVRFMLICFVLMELWELLIFWLNGRPSNVIFDGVLTPWLYSPLWYGWREFVLRLAFGLGGPALIAGCLMLNVFRPRKAKSEYEKRLLELLNKEALSHGFLWKNLNVRTLTLYIFCMNLVGEVRPFIFGRDGDWTDHIRPFLQNLVGSIIFVVIGVLTASLLRICLRKYSGIYLSALAAFIPYFLFALWCDFVSDFCLPGGSVYLSILIIVFAYKIMRSGYGFASVGIYRTPKGQG